VTACRVHLLLEFPRSTRCKTETGARCVHTTLLVLHGDEFGLLYCNDGDWVESCTALVEHESGKLEIVTWRPRAAVASLAKPLRDAA
jgi:UDP-2,3-diacylglucosamine pyrophosphatase LpxH